MTSLLLFYKSVVCPLCTALVFFYRIIVYPVYLSFLLYRISVCLVCISLLLFYKIVVYPLCLNLLFFTGLLCIHCVYICCFSQDCCVSTVYIQHVTPNQAPEQLMAKNLDTGEFCRVDLIGFTTPYSRGQITKADLSEV